MSKVANQQEKNSMGSANDPLFSIEQAAEYLGLSIATIRTWVWQRRIPTYRIGRAVRMRRSSLDEVIENGFVPAGQRASARVA